MRGSSFGLSSFRIALTCDFWSSVRSRLSRARTMPWPNPNSPNGPPWWCILAGTATTAPIASSATDIDATIARVFLRELIVTSFVKRRRLRRRSHSQTTAVGGRSHVKMARCYGPDPFPGAGAGLRDWNARGGLGVCFRGGNGEGRKRRGGTYLLVAIVLAPQFLAVA